MPVSFVVTLKMHSLIIASVLCVAVITATPTEETRIGGKWITNEIQSGFVASTLYSSDGVTFAQVCVGSILNPRTLLSSASCYAGEPVNRWRIRVGSAFANSGGVIHNVAGFIIHPNFNAHSRDNDIALVRSASFFSYNQAVRPITVPGFSLPDNMHMTALRWNLIGATVEERVTVSLFAQNVNAFQCRSLLSDSTVTNNMLCSNVNNFGQSQCDSDNGSPLVFNNMIVGVYSWRPGCNDSRPDIYTRVANYFLWIRANA